MSTKADNDKITDADIAVFLQDSEDDGKRHLFCDVCDPEKKVALCGYKRKDGAKRKTPPIIAIIWRWPIVLWRLRSVCKRCRELAMPHAQLHAGKVI